MKSLSDANITTFSSVRFVLTDMDETLTYRGRLAARTYDALERLQSGGLVVIPVTAAPAGWCDQMARMWPVDGVIGENGGLFVERDGHNARRTFWSDTAEADRIFLATLAAEITRDDAAVTLADDQPFRLSTLAFKTSGPEKNAALEATLQRNGLYTTQNNLWVLGWRGGFDKLNMARRTLAARYGLDIDTAGDAVLYVGDSLNDAPMFSHFRHTVGVSTITECLPVLPKPPQWITVGPGGDGFVEVASAVLASRGRP